jgi:phosphoribosylaminoimidazole-succinocarboxamide synthase
MISDELIKAQLAKTLETTDFPALGSKYEGKVRDCYIKDNRRIIVVTDRISAFDVVLGTIPFKGQVLNQIAAYWFEVTKQLASNHVLEVPDPTVMIATECEIIPVEFVMRSYVTGVTTTSIWHHYSHGARRFCGHDLPDGMRKNQKLDRPILTPSTKAAKGGHDQSVSRDEVLASGALTLAEFERAAEMCARVFAFGQSLASQRGMILVDTKYEIGRRRDGSLCFVDEVHTPDSSRYWYADDYQERFDRGEEPRGLDKEYVRHVLAAQGYTGEGAPPPLTDEVRCEASRRYMALYELVTGREFVPNFDEPLARIQKNLKF